MRKACQPLIVQEQELPCGDEGRHLSAAVDPPTTRHRPDGIAPKDAIEVGPSQPCRDGELARECPTFCVSVIWSMLPERSKDDDDFQRTAGRAAEGLQAA